MSTANIVNPPIKSDKGSQCFWNELPGSSLTLAIANAARCHANPFLVVTADNLSANTLLHELRFFYRDQSDAPRVMLFPDWETLPFDQFSPHEDIISQRLIALHDMPSMTRGIVICPISTLMHRLAPRGFVEANTFIYAVGDRFDLEKFRKNLTSVGYRHVTEVYSHGEFCIRGSIIDLFPMGSDVPFRIDLFDNEIDSIRSFDPEKQTSLEKLSNIRLLPAREFPLTEIGVTHFRQAWRQQFTGNPRLCSLYDDISQGIIPSGIEYYLPLFFDETHSLLDYMPTSCVVIKLSGLMAAAENFWHEASERYEQLSYDVTRPILPVDQIFMNSNASFAAMNRFDHVVIKADDAATKFAALPTPQLFVDSKAENPFFEVQKFLQSVDQRVLFCAESNGRRQVIVDLLHDIQIDPISCDSWQQFLASDDKIMITVGELENGLLLQSPAICVITESQLFAQHIMQARRRKSRRNDSDVIVKDLTELHIGMPVVHLNHGVGIYRGLTMLDANDVRAEYLTLEYAGGDRIYVPVMSLDLISRYTGPDSDVVQLTKLGTDKWSRAKRKALEKIRDVASELLALYAQRHAKKGFQFTLPSTPYHTFANGFPFEPTPDQEKAINDVINDMCSERCMDRLLCGDVGFGKTEVAMRAAFIAVHNAKQVAVLVPTTLLADQHYQTFCDRFADFPVTIALLSRFKSAKEQEEILEKVRHGKIDIVIGTHKLIQKTIGFKDLGLLVIDEEHRFGVKQKDQIKALKNEVDILTLTATPIPRTLNLAMASLRDISIIATAPAKRLSIKTFHYEQNPIVIKEAILREVMRGGQVFYLHNNIETINHRAQEISEWVKQAKVNVAHGQMRERELENVMSDFYHRRFNVLVCSTIIETGIDIPTANTIIIERADCFGLAQLHQLRGRVGRSHHQAYAYLMTPPKKSLTKDATKRLEALLSMEDLGAGFNLATHDLEIRGAGEILGEEQSGNIEAIGFTLFMELLERAVKSLKSGKILQLDSNEQTSCEVNLNISALIPDDYLPDVHMRLILYRRISNAKTHNDLRELQVEMIDRFGLLPVQVKNLFRVSELRFRAVEMGIRRIEGYAEYFKIDFGEKPDIDPAIVVKLIQTQPKTYQMLSPTTLRCNASALQAEQRIEAVSAALTRLRAG